MEPSGTRGPQLPHRTTSLPLLLWQREGMFRGGSHDEPVVTQGHGLFTPLPKNDREQEVGFACPALPSQVTTLDQFLNAPLYMPGTHGRTGGNSFVQQETISGLA